MHPSPSIIYAKNQYSQQNISIFLEQVSINKTEISYAYCDIFKKIEFNDFDLSFIHLANEIEKCFDKPVLNDDVICRLKNIYINKLSYLCTSIQANKKIKKSSTKSIFDLFFGDAEIHS